MTDRSRLTSQRLRLLLSIGIILATANLVSGQGSRRIARIDTEGLQNLTKDTVIATSGLKIGDRFSVEAVDAAAQRLIDSGLFKKVGYRTNTSGTAVTIVFQLEEVKGNQSPVIFDNFIWFSDEELAAAIRSEVPTFNGSAPDAGDTTAAIKKALQNLLVERKLPGNVEYMLTETAHQFSVTGVPMKICTLRFPGANAVSEEKLIQTTRGSMNADYSRESAKTFPKYGLFPLYWELGYLRATFGAPIAKPDTTTSCDGGVDLTIPVSEGTLYSWEKAEWSGNTVLSPAQLDAALGMKAGEVANGVKFDKGKREVEKLYGKHGHIAADLSSNPVFNDAAQRVTFKISVSEGPQFRMGTVEFRGISAADNAALKEKWRLKSGEVYDQSYASRFFQTDGSQVFSKIALEWQAQHKRMPSVRTAERANRQTLTVNVIVEFKN